MDYFRVTEILYPFGGLKHVPTDTLERAAVRGTKVHKACEGIVKGLEGWGLSDECQRYVDSFMHWYRKKPEIISVEERFFCDELGITGQCDLVVRTPTGDIIVDIKTSAAPQKSWMLQGSAYSYLARKKGYNITGMMFLKLDRDGKEPREYVYEENMDLYKKCLDVYKYFYATKKRKMIKK